MKKMMIALVAMLLATACLAEETPVRTWTWKSGNTVEASFIKIFTSENGRECVSLKKANGKKTGPVIKFLSDEDQAYIKSLAK